MLVNWLVHKRIAGTRLWFGFVLSAAIACIFQSSQALSSVWSIMVPNTLILLGLFMLTRGVERFFIVRVYNWPWFLLASVFFPSFIYFTFIDASFLVRVVVNYLVWLLAMTLCLRALWIGQGKSLVSFSPAHWTFAIACVSLLSVFTLRLSMLGHYEHSDSLGTNNWMNQFFSLSVIVMPLILCFSLCLLCSCRKEQLLANVTQRAKEETQKKAQFLTLLSHELRTPLNAIVGHAEMIKQAPREPQKYVQYCDVIISTAMSLADLANQVLLNARGKASRQVAVVLPAFIQQLMEQFKPLVQDKSVELEVRSTAIASHKQYLIDQDTLGLVIKNLLSNAIKYTHQGKITLAVSMLRKKSQSELLRFEVADTGEGMNQTQIEQLFQPFDSADPELSIAQSAGVGLALCQQLLETLGSKLEVRSEIAQGSLFYFDIELVEATDTSPEVASKALNNRSISQLSGNILVVEDNLLNQEIIKHFLSSLSLDYQIASSLTEAEQQLNTTVFDLIFLDMHLRDGHGLDWYRQTFKSLNLTHMPVVVAITGDVDEQAQQAYLSAGIEYFMAKPIVLPDLEKLLSKLLVSTRHLSLDHELLDLSTIERLAGSMEPQVLSTKLMYLSDRLDYEFAQLRGLADIQALEALEEKLIQLEEEVSSLGMRALYLALQDVRLTLFDSINVDWHMLHGIAKQSAKRLSEYHSKVVA
ncbi:ATP-binding protein [Pseudoalteromonas sp. SMS1]|uniref:ATP-binding protein n=1 Tax=Pseudoalteromonas sp. SMS1 TaxID=2908894 RepID=UPI001F176A8F|nr:ATP-binding protein [Pseudoalteromonas sp. SMS1]MCF2857565.1 ATP-binding protein [Pseudoalteromonas sp. SMS1]